MRMAHSNASSPSSADQQSQAPQPVVIRQGGNGLALIIAALIVAAAGVYAVNRLTQEKQQKAPMSVTPEQVQQGLEKLKGIAEKTPLRPN